MRPLEFDNLCKLDGELYKVFKKEVEVFFDKKKDNKFKIFPTHNSVHHFLTDFVYKVIPIWESMILSDRTPELSRILLKIIDQVETEPLIQLYYKLSDMDVYGSNLLIRKVNTILGRNNNYYKIRRMILMTFNAQPIKEKKFPQTTVGMSDSSLSEVMDE